MLGLITSTSSSNDSEAPFSMLFGTQQHQPNPSNPFVLNWGVHHEKNGVASVLQGFQNVIA
jgi:hypothetical protein